MSNSVSLAAEWAERPQSEHEGEEARSQVAKASAASVLSQRLLLVDVPQAALMSISRQFAWKLVYANEWRSLRVGRRRVIAVRDLEAWVEARLAEADEG